jgi:tripartite-type tricarboxylate transporter receptor subunit TctC
VPRGTPQDIIEKLNREINAGLSDPKVRQRITDLGNIPLPLSLADFGKLLINDTEKWGSVIRALNIKGQ